jgi:hypothetical protein
MSNPWKMFTQGASEQEETPPMPNSPWAQFMRDLNGGKKSSSMASSSEEKEVMGNTNNFRIPTYGENNLLTKMLGLIYRHNEPQPQKNRANAIDLYRGFEDAVWDTVSEEDPNFKTILDNARKQDLISQKSSNRAFHVIAGKYFERTLNKDVELGKLKGKTK